jgi:hypothetical protein
MSTSNSDDFDNEIRLLYGQLAGHAQKGADIHREELRVLFKCYLKDRYTEAEFELICDLQRRLHKRQFELANQLTANAVFPVEYADQFNVAIRDTFRQCEAVLGSERFLLAFGAMVSGEEGYIDVPTFVRHYDSDQSGKGNLKSAASTDLDTSQEIGSDDGKIVSMIPRPVNTENYSGGDSSIRLSAAGSSYHRIIRPSPTDFFRDDLSLDADLLASSFLAIAVKEHRRSAGRMAGELSFEKIYLPDGDHILLEWSSNHSVITPSKSARSGEFMWISAVSFIPAVNAVCLVWECEISQHRLRVESGIDIDHFLIVVTSNRLRGRS